MSTKARAHVIIEEDIVKEIDRLVGKKKRSSFIAAAAKKELKRLRQYSIIKKLKGTWRDEDHPELSGKEGTYKWVRKLRDEDEKVLRKKLA
ncbi:MAG: hypothetical protein AB1638_06125 [Nitrospirota bacterium]